MTGNALSFVPTPSVDSITRTARGSPGQDTARLQRKMGLLPDSQSSPTSSTAPSAAYVLELDALSRRIDTRTLVGDISLKVRAAEIVAIIGPSGGGKSTLLRMVNRLDEPTKGTVYLKQADYRNIPPPDLRRRIGMVLQSAFLFPGTVRSNLVFGPAQKHETLGNPQIEDLLKQVGLSGYADHDVSTLSGGEAQRVSLARTLANRPEVLLLDEPTSALDEASTREVELLVQKIVEQSKVPCLIVTHNPAQAARLADRALYMDGGRVLAIGPAKEIVDAHRSV